MTNDPQVQQQMMQQMNTMMNDPELRQQMMQAMMQDPQALFITMLQSESFLICLLVN